MAVEDSDKAARKSDILDAPPRALLEGTVENTGFSAQCRLMWIAFVRSPTRNTLVITAFGILALIIIIARGQLAINDWMGTFWNAVQTHDMARFLYLLGLFFLLAGGLLILNVTQTFLNQFLKLKLREGLTGDLIDEWLKPRRAFRMTLAGEIGVNPDQRLHEDARHLAEATADLGINLVQATVILCTFLKVLWDISSGFIFHVNGYVFPIPGYLIWAVLLYAGTASFLTWLVGRNLVGLNANRYAKEAELRAALIRTNHHIGAITLAHGEASENGRLRKTVNDVLDAIWRIALATTKLTGITAGYGWVSNVAPIIIASPIYFGGGVDFGGLMRAVNSFNQAHGSLRWFVDNFGAIADWRATMLRVASFRQALCQMDQVDDRREGVITAKTGQEDRLIFDHLTARTANGRLSLSEKQIIITRGENLLIFADINIDKRILFEAITGLWPWGSGDVILPANDHIAYMPQSAYIPVGTLRHVLTYPAAPTHVTEDDILKALNVTGLYHYATALDQDADWERILNEEERQCINFCRIILARPKWVFANQVMDGVADDVRHRIGELIEKEFQDTSIIYLTRRNDRTKTFGKQVTAVFTPYASEKSENR